MILKLSIFFLYGKPSLLLGILCTKIFIEFILCFYLLCRGKSGDCRNLVYELNVQGTLFTAKSEFRVMNTDHGFWLKSRLKKIGFSQNMGLEPGFLKKNAYTEQSFTQFPPVSNMWHKNILLSSSVCPVSLNFRCLRRRRKKYLLDFCADIFNILTRFFNVFFLIEWWILFLTKLLRLLIQVLRLLLKTRKLSKIVQNRIKSPFLHKGKKKSLGPNPPQELEESPQSVPYF